MTKLFVWDFHGVLEKDNDLAVLDISNQILESAGYAERFTAKDNRKYYGLKWYEYFERLLPGLSKEQHMALQAACFKFAEENLHILANHIKPNDYVIEVLDAIQNAGHDQIIISNTRPADLEWFVEAINIGLYFPPEKLFGVNAHEKHGMKKDALRHYLENKQYKEIVIIGDSVPDMELKEVKGGVSYFYSHPHLSQDGKLEADYIITDLRKILSEA